MGKVLAAIDLSPRSEEVLRQAALWAKRSDSELTIYHVVGVPTHLPEEVYSIAPAELPQFLRDEAEQRIRKIVQQLAATVPVRIAVEIGHGWGPICEAAKRERADLIVVGSHGYSTLDRFIGGTARRVVEHADRPVLVVRPPQA